MLVTDCTRQEAGELLDVLNEIVCPERSEQVRPTLSALVEAHEITFRQAGLLIDLLNALQKSERTPRAAEKKVAV